MTPTIDAMIERALALDAKATPAPWDSTIQSYGETQNAVGPTHNDSEGMDDETHAVEFGLACADADMISEGRSLLPILARALQVAVDALERVKAGEYAVCLIALPEIEAICEGKA